MRRVNESLSSGKAEGGSATPSEGKGGSLGIGLLDVFGFEIFEVNSRYTPYTTPYTHYSTPCTPYTYTPYTLTGQ